MACRKIRARYDSVGKFVSGIITEGFRSYFLNYDINIIGNYYPHMSSLNILIVSFNINELVIKGKKSISHL